MSTIKSVSVAQSWQAMLMAVISGRADDGVDGYATCRQLSVSRRVRFAQDPIPPQRAIRAYHFSLISVSRPGWT